MVQKRVRVPKNKPTAKETVENRKDSFRRKRVSAKLISWGRKTIIGTITGHMPKAHQKYLEWNGDRFHKWAGRIGINT